MQQPTCTSAVKESTLGNNFINLSTPCWLMQAQEQKSDRACQGPDVASYIPGWVIVFQRNHGEDNPRGTYPECTAHGRSGFALTICSKRKVKPKRLVERMEVHHCQSLVFSAKEDRLRWALVVLLVRGIRPSRASRGKVGGTLFGPSDLQQELVRILDSQNGHQIQLCALV